MCACVFRPTAFRARGHLVEHALLVRRRPAHARHQGVHEGARLVGGQHPVAVAHRGVDDLGRRVVGRGVGVQARSGVVFFARRDEAFSVVLD